jgi:hypothetical protein
MQILLVSKYALSGVDSMGGLCRWVAYSGEPILIDDLLFKARASANRR